MDDQRFDALTRRLATRSSRRGVLGGLLAGVLGGLLGRSGPVEAKPRTGRAPTLATACTTDAECGPGQVCDPATGSCIARGGTGRGGPCPRGSACTTDATCCGGEVCDTLNGVCIGAGGPCTNVDGTCFDSLDCCGNEACVGGTCQRTTAGGCTPGAVCAGDGDCCGGEVCVNGVCAKAAHQAGCGAGMARCAGTCVDIQNDPANCGACGAGCGVGLTCVSGVCTGAINCDVDEDCPDCHYCGRNHPGPVPKVCNPCAGGAAGGPCLTCGDDGRCRPLCPGCDECIGDGMGGATCRGECPPCTICDVSQGMCVQACGRCESCAVNADGSSTCLPTECGVCSFCDPVSGFCMGTCGPCEACQYDGVSNTYTCTTTCVEGQQCLPDASVPPSYTCG